MPCLRLKGEADTSNYGTNVRCHEVSIVGSGLGKDEIQRRDSRERLAARNESYLFQAPKLSSNSSLPDVNWIHCRL